MTVCSALELHEDTSLQSCEYSFSPKSVLRNGVKNLSLDGEWCVCKTLSCGICCTDCARHFLPYPLPQIIGHEVIVAIPDSHALLKDADFAAVEINSNCRQKSCPYCANNTLPTQCPRRITMGINTWPGGLAPFMVAPVENMIPIPRNTLSLLSATLIEPFAAALHAIDSSSLQQSDHVAILGAGKLGLLAILALDGRRKSDPKFSNIQITALVRDGNLQHVSLAQSFGADHIVSVPKSEEGEDSALANLEFDVVFDTTGNPKGLHRAISLAKREVHLKSTHGQPVFGMRHWTEMVVAELALIPATAQDLISRLAWRNPAVRTEPSGEQKMNIYVAPSAADQLPTELLNHSDYTLHTDLSIAEADAALELGSLGEHLLSSGSRLPRYDAAIVSSPDDVDGIVFPSRFHDKSLVAPRGAIFYLSAYSSRMNENAMALLLQKGTIISTSRCGDFKRALQVLLQRDGDKAELIGNKLQQLVTHRYSLSDLPLAMEVARGNRADGKKPVKIVVDCANVF
ncbi:hypothetical protein BJ741DRAFT_602614 [Chytriomyces cf. hyalinus JEL632]|nr:hypothetical protein BJ741DRAFT_602614 [Chytriomyces cf. hyalinus JEL632]